MSVVWTETATSQLQAIKDYLSQSSPGYAQALARRIIARTETLDGHPFFGPQVQEYADPQVRELFEHPYRIVYRVVGQDIQVVAIVHASRRFPKTPPT